MMATRRMSWLEQIVTIENKGFDAFKAGVAESANPYQKSGAQSGTGGSVQRQRRLAWIRGWELAKAEFKH